MVAGGGGKEKGATLVAPFVLTWTTSYGFLAGVTFFVVFVVVFVVVVVSILCVESIIIELSIAVGTGAGMTVLSTAFDATL